MPASICPITQAEVKDLAIIAADGCGHEFEFSALLAWTKDSIKINNVNRVDPYLIAKRRDVLIPEDHAKCPSCNRHYNLGNIQYNSTLENERLMMTAIVELEDQKEAARARRHTHAHAPTITHAQALHLVRQRQAALRAAQVQRAEFARRGPAECVIS